jgi:hypothetical protein
MKCLDSNFQKIIEGEYNVNLEEYERNSYKEVKLKTFNINKSLSITSLINIFSIDIAIKKVLLITTITVFYLLKPVENSVSNITTISYNKYNEMKNTRSVLFINQTYNITTLELEHNDNKHNFFDNFLMNFTKEKEEYSVLKPNLLRMLIDNTTNPNNTNNSTTPIIEKIDPCSILNDCYNCSLYTTSSVNCKWKDGKCTTDKETR